MRRSIPVIVAVILVVSVVTITVPLSNSNLRSNSPIDSDNIEQYMKEQVELGPRHPGSNGSLAFRDWILDTVPDGWDIEIQSFTYNEVEVRNYWITSYTSDTWPAVIIGAHYDSRKVADQDPENPELPVPGANDGASGVAAILEMIKHIPTNRTNDIGFVLFDAEDQGSGGMPGWRWIVGSNYFADQMTPTQVDQTQLFLLYDMIADDELILEYEGYSNETLSESIWDTAIDLGYGSIFKKREGVSLVDDHRPFLDLGISSVDLIDFDYPEWHTTADNMQNVSPENAAIVVDAVLYWLNNVFFSEFYQLDSSEPTQKTSSTTNTDTQSANYPLQLIPVILVMMIRRWKSSVSY